MRSYAETVTEPTPPPRIRVRWGWFVGCVILGLAAITAGWFVAAPPARADYLAGVLAGVGTTLLLVGVVVLLERRIVDSAVSVVRNAATEARLRSNEELREQISDLEDRLAVVWANASAENTAEKSQHTARMTAEFAKRVVDESSGEPA